MSTKTHPQSTPATRAAKRPKGRVGTPSDWNDNWFRVLCKIPATDEKYYTSTHFAVIPCRTRNEARALVKLHNYRDSGVRALAQSCEALKQCKNRRELNATISFIVDYFITRPSKELPPHLQRPTP